MSARPSMLASALDALYTAAPSEFVARRRALAAEAKKAGLPEIAKRIAAARKPTQAAYLLNQLARRESEAVASLVDVGRVLERAQRAALRTGEGGPLREAIAMQRTALRALTKKAIALAAQLDVALSPHALAGALQAAVGNATTGAELEAGQLSTPPEAEGTFGGFGGGATIADAAVRPAAPTKPVATKPVATKPVATKPVATKPVAAKAVAAKRAAAAKREKAERELAARAAELEAAARARKQAAERKAAADAAAKLADREADAAAREAKELEAAAHAAQRAATKARAHADALREHARKLRD